MVGRDVPAQTYVVFESHGLSDIHHTYRQIEEWFPTSGYQPGTGPDFELYPEDFNPDDPQSLLYIYFPVKTS
jgi:predicted transcriptional regulator YdeE